jgi:3-(3-hydroxy-phenyl)propionate hydroxylase
MRPIVIAGGGPVGLTTALGLVHYGLPVIVLEEDDSLSRDTKAGTVLTRTLEVFDRYGVVDDVLEKSLRIDEIGDVDRETGETLRSIKTWLLADDTKYPFIINIPQHFLEPVLARRLEELAPGALKMSHRVTGFEQHSDHVAVQYQSPDGGGVIDASYLLACDGGRSETRKAIGAAVDGTTFEEKYMLVDVAVDLDVDNPRDYPYLAYFAHPREWMILVRQPEFWRFLYPRHPDTPELDGEQLADKAREYIGDVTDMTVVGSYEYSVHVRTADRWRDRRVFLMGDAAHLITPMWALGLNTGVLDTSNLPWRLAWVERGWASPSLLDGYESEQAPLAGDGSGAMAEAARQYMTRQSQSLEAMTEFDWANAMTRCLLAVRLDVKGTGDWAITVSEAEPPPLSIGDRIPDLPLQGPRSSLSTHDLVRDRFAALYFTDVRRRPPIPDPTAALAHYAVSRWDAPLDGAIRDRSLLDVGGRVEERFGCPPDTILLIRPDGHVADLGPMGERSAEDMYQMATGMPSTVEEE